MHSNPHPRRVARFGRWAARRLPQQQRLVLQGSIADKGAPDVPQCLLALLQQAALHQAVRGLCGKQSMRQRMQVSHGRLALTDACECSVAGSCSSRTGEKGQQEQHDDGRPQRHCAVATAAQRHVRDVYRHNASECMQLPATKRVTAMRKCRAMQPAAAALTSEDQPPAIRQLCQRLVTE